ncbi:MAG: hypothetical protein CO003_01650 [Candidatus Portnoybacteria bacterium CG_4_8_14_3_um_filter_44_15]|uniref:Uncharacterized protein n=1 Tax=Candidatus Portnoybacteria bacterium CG_4_8_14_3_um_filter_44_15 TaxID=1974803 RepID=A0A2M7IDQ7_9BACT|nr:MAG: hypothetical protein CO003_01650 [Candidatus Portnoybacteria bacterium CG_4_8_14_3_um_filter_44_15]
MTIYLKDSRFYKTKTKEGKMKITVEEKDGIIQASLTEVKAGEKSERLILSNFFGKLLKAAKEKKVVIEIS